MSVVPTSKRPYSYINKNYEVIRKIDKAKWLNHGRATSYAFINKNEFPISGIVIGFLKKDYKQSNCSSNRDDYDALVFCGSSNASSGVGSMQYGELSCQDSATKFPEQSTCILGYRPAIDYFTEGLAKFMDKQRLCEP